MKTLITDTSILFENQQIMMLKDSSVQTRLSRLLELGSLTRKLSYRALKRKNPGLKKDELDLLFVKLIYGESLYNNVLSHLIKKNAKE